jgi:hypothetical protein
MEIHLEFGGFDAVQYYYRVEANNPNESTVFHAEM